MQHYFITGTSTGIGNALATALLQRSNTHIVGLGRSCTIEHERYTHHTIDLSIPEAAKTYEFEVPATATKIVLINNAGTLGEVGPLGAVADEAIEQAFYLNLIAPAVLMNRFAQ